MSLNSFFKQSHILIIGMFFLFLNQQLNAQVFEGDITLSLQAEVDAFNYTEVTGYLRIDGNACNN